jgi:GNAT superfamily N-acetyltransferase
VLDPADPDLDPRARRAALARRAVRFEQALADRLVTTTDRTPYGIARFSPDLPRVWSLNAIEVTRPVAVVELLADVERRFGAHDLPFRNVTTTVPEVAWVLAPALHTRGWDLERLVVMVHDGRTASPVSPLGIGPVALDRWAGYARTVRAGEPWGRDAGTQADMAARDRRLDERVDVTWVMERDASAGCQVLRHGPVAQIENVYVLAEARGRGLGDGLMAAARAACGDATLVFLIADGDDWPQRWYARLGFEPVCSGWGWVHQV